MLKIVLFICLVSFSLLFPQIVPMKKKNKFGDDICYYQDKDSEDIYVKACEEGKYCESETGDSNFKTCQDIPKTISLKTFGEECSNDFECEFNLVCSGRECTQDCSGNPNTKPVKISGSYYRCIDKDLIAPEGFCYYAESKWVPNSPDSTSGYMEYIEKYGNYDKKQLCGHITKFNNNLNSHTIKEVKPASIGTLEDGEYVLNPLLCKSGYALYFFADEKKLINPITIPSFVDNMFLMCVTPVNMHINQFYSQTCIISYNFNGKNEQIYNVDQIKGKTTANLVSYSTSLSPIPHTDNLHSISDSIIRNLCTEYLNIKTERFKEYIANLTETDNREKCGDLENNIENKINCNNKDILKAWYYYKHPKNYYIYYDKKGLEGVVDYLIQSEYYSYPGYGNVLRMNLLFITLLLFLLWN